VPYCQKYTGFTTEEEERDLLIEELRFQYIVLSIRDNQI